MIDPDLLNLCFKLEALVHSPAFIGAIAVLGVIGIVWLLLARREPF